MGSFSFQKKHRLLTKSEYSQVFDRVDYRIAKGPVLLLARKNDLEHCRLGLVARKKFLKKAVDRNLFKRLCREKFRLKQQELINLDIILMNRQGAEDKTKKELRTLIGKTVDRLPLKQK